MAVYQYQNGVWSHQEQHASTTLSNRLFGADRTSTTLSDHLGVYNKPVALAASGHNYMFLATKKYELSNHLGNVMAVVTDRRFVHSSGGFATAEAVTERSRSVVSATDYFVFGSAMPSREFNGSAYDFGFNTQMESPEILPGHTTAMYWEYDGRIGRRWELDPVVKVWESGYACLGNNPIWLSDKYGDTVDGDMVAYGRVKGKLNNEVASLNTQIDEVNTNIAERKLEGKETNRLEKKLENLKRNKDVYQGVLNELTELENSAQNYHIVTNEEVVGDHKGVTRYNPLTKNIDVLVAPSSEVIDVLPHELKHAYQFQKGLLSFTYNKAVDLWGTGRLYDIEDEVEAFKRQQLFGYHEGVYINATWVRRRGVSYSKLPEGQQSMNTINNPSFNDKSEGSILIQKIYKQGVKGENPTEIFIGWENYYNQGKNGQPLSN
jgi:hypothetical protein